MLVLLNVTMLIEFPNKKEENEQDKGLPNNCEIEQVFKVIDCYKIANELGGKFIDGEAAVSSGEVLKDKKVITHRVMNRNILKKLRNKNKP